MNYLMLALELAEALDVALDSAARQNIAATEVWRERDALRVENSRLREALQAVEWVRVGSVFYPVQMCPWCEQDKTTGHAPDCLRQRAMGVAP